MLTDQLVRTCAHCGKTLASQNKTSYCPLCKDQKVTATCSSCSKDYSVSIRTMLKQEKAGETLCRSCMVKKNQVNQNLCVACGEPLPTQNTSGYHVGCKSKDIHIVCSCCGEPSTYKPPTYFALLQDTGDIICRSCVKKQHNQEKHGCDSYFQTEEFKSKKKQHNQEKYGCDSYLQTEEFKRKRETSLVKSLGVTAPCKAPSILKKRENTNLERFGTRFPSQSADVEARRVRTYEEKYGAKGGYGSSVVRDKAERTMTDRYGSKHANHVPALQEKRSKTVQDRTPEQKRATQEKTKTTCLARYGVPHFCQTSEFSHKKKSRYLYDNIYFDSSWELAFFIYHKDLGEPVERVTEGIPYTWKNKTHLYFPDFKINDQVYEIKGDHLLKVAYASEVTLMKIQVAKDNRIILLYEKDIQPYLSYIRTTYGKEYLKQFQIHKK